MVFECLWASDHPWLLGGSLGRIRRENSMVSEDQERWLF